MIQKLRPGQELTERHVNQIIDAVNSAQITSSDFPLERSSAGIKLKMPRVEQDFYAQIVEPEEGGQPIRKREKNGDIWDGEYEWIEVYLPDTDPEHGEYPPEGFSDLASGRGSFFDPLQNNLFSPAYELGNNRKVPIGSLVRMRVYPPFFDDYKNGRGFINRYIFTYAMPTQLLLAEAVGDWEENGSYPEGSPRIRVVQMVTDPDKEPTENEPHPKKAVDDENGDRLDFWVELPRERPGGTAYDDVGLSHGADPALYSADRLYYSVDDQGRFVCQSPYLHMAKIGCIRMMGLTGTYPRDNVPKGWAVCEGQALTGEAGRFNLANFNREQAAVGGSTDVFGAIPMHESATYGVGDDGELWVFDAIGDGFAPSPIQLPDEGRAATDIVGAHQHEFEVQRGEYPLEAVLFYQRYK